MGSFPPHRFSAATAKPFGDLSAPTEVHLVDNGMAAGQISVQCEVHYYGSDCSKFCQPRSDYNGGHYYCDMDGNKICKPIQADPAKWWYLHRPCRLRLPRLVSMATPVSSRRRVPIDLAVSGKGAASARTGFRCTYSCHCLGAGPGWRGRNCTEDIDEWQNNGLSATCFNGGNCENTPGSFTWPLPVRVFPAGSAKRTSTSAAWTAGLAQTRQRSGQSCWSSLSASIIPLWPPVLVAGASAVSALSSADSGGVSVPMARAAAEAASCLFQGPSKDSKEYSTTGQPNGGCRRQEACGEYWTGALPPASTAEAAEISSGDSNSGNRWDSEAEEAGWGQAMSRTACYQESITKYHPLETVTQLSSRQEKVAS
uniref:Delta-like protein n=1 Tax=Macrostomum lignano TaxID=282301 RepID=A0A1I8JP98_9PLAT